MMATCENTSQDKTSDLCPRGTESRISDQTAVDTDSRISEKTAIGTEKGCREASENDGLVAKEAKATTASEVQHLRQGVLVVSWVTLVLLGGLGVLTCVISFAESSNAAFAFALDAGLICATSLVLIWRFSSQDKALIYSQRRERIACITLGVLFLLSAAALAGRSIASIVYNIEPETHVVILAVSAVNGLICVPAAVAEFYIGTKLGSSSIIADGMNTTIAAIIAFSTVTESRLVSEHSSIWYIDSSVGIICAVFLLGYGIRLLCLELCRRDTGADEIQLVDISSSKAN